jgi:hypothetical protein
MIKMSYAASDGFCKEASFSDKNDARRYFQMWAGKNFDAVGQCAVSFDGVSRIFVEGASIESMQEEVY